jgi:molybdopterin-guanine dinucleotide biosynthesis adapter protein
MNKVIGVAGFKNAGKTTLVEKLVVELTGRGWRVSTVKHAHHSFDIDHEGRDSFRHRKAGASEVAVVSRHRWAIIHESRAEEEPPLADILAKLAPCDLVIVEGYKRDFHDKIEVRNLELSDHYCCGCRWVRSGCAGSRFQPG